MGPAGKPAGRGQSCADAAVGTGGVSPPAERQLRDDPMYLNCKPPGGPRQYQSRLGVEFVEDRARQRIFLLMGSGNHNYRIVYMDAESHDGLGYRR